MARRGGIAKAIDARFICVQANDKLTSLQPVTRGEANFPCAGIPVFDNLKAGADGYIAGNGSASSQGPFQRSQC